MSNIVKLRVQTVSYYDVNLDTIEEHYGTDDPVEAAQIDQANYRDDGSALIEMLADQDVVVYVQVFDPGGQMFTDEAVREFIQIVNMKDLEIHINSEAMREKRVHAVLVGILDGARLIKLDGFGPTMGFALRDVREQLRIISGQ